MPPDETDEERLEQLPEDNQRPFSPPDTAGTDSTAPGTDSEVDSTELYQEGLKSPSNSDTGVVGYDPTKDQRQ